jgi:hypothetical protein
MTANFGGMFKTQFELEMDRVNSLMKEIGDKYALVASLCESLAKLFAGDLEKLAGASDLTKRLVATKSLLSEANVEIDKLNKLMEECSQAQTLARLAMPFAFITDGPVVPGRAFFTATKDASAVPFVMPGQKPAIPAVSASDAALARRFSLH